MLDIQREAPAFNSAPPDPPKEMFAEHAAIYLALGYSPIPVFQEGKRPTGWTAYCLKAATPEKIQDWGDYRPAPNVALACGYSGLVAIDVDVSDIAIITAVLDALPHCRIARFGSKGFALLCRYVGAEKRCWFKNIYAPKDGKGHKQVLVEIHGDTHNIVAPPSLHRKTGRAYLWINPASGEALADQNAPALDKLPTIDDEDIARLRKAMEPWAELPVAHAPRPKSNGFVNTGGDSRLEKWARAGLSNQFVKLSGLVEGRPTELFRGVCSLGWAVHHGFIPEQEFINTFMDACANNGLLIRDGERAIEASIRSGLHCAENDPLPELGDRPQLKKTKKNGRIPHDDPPPGGGGNGNGGGGGGGGGGDGQDASGGGEPPNDDAFQPIPEYSETAIAERLIAAHRHELRYVKELGQWLVWTGSCWKPDRKARAFSRARKFCLEAANEMLAEAAASKRGVTPEALKFARSLTSARGRAAVDKLAREDGRMLILPEELDRDDWLLNTPDGVIDLKTGEMREHRADDFMTMQTSVSPDKNCPTPEWTKYLNKVTNGDAGKITYLQRSAGYFLTGDIGKESVWFFYGPGANGKGVFTTALARILNDYHCTAPIEILLEAQHERHPADLARLARKRLITLGEPDEDKSWSEAKLKQISGGDPIVCRHMRQNPWEYIPNFKPLISGNHKPAFRSVNEAIKRRIKLVLFDVIIPKEERDPELKKDKLVPELPGILWWMIQGCLDMLKHGLEPPDAVMEATTEYLGDEDALANWFADRCDLDELGFEKSADLFDDWRQWKTDNGVQSAIGSKSLTQKLVERKEWMLTKYNDSKRGRGLRGVSFKPDVAAEREDDRKAKLGAKERARGHYNPQNDRNKP